MKNPKENLPIDYEEIGGKVYVKAHYKDAEGVESVIKDKQRYVPANFFHESEEPVWINFKVSRTYQVRQYEPFHVEAGFILPARSSEAMAAFKQFKDEFQDEINKEFMDAESMIKKLRSRR